MSWALWGRADAVRLSVTCEHQCGYGARLDGMTNVSELLINTVMNNKPKMLTGLNQKVSGRIPHVLLGYTDIMTAGGKAGSNPSRYSCETR